MNIVTASFNTAMRQMTELSHDQNVSAKNYRKASEKKQSLWAVVYLEVWTKGQNLAKAKTHGHILNFSGYGRVFWHFVGSALCLMRDFFFAFVQFLCSLAVCL